MAVIFLLAAIVGCVLAKPPGKNVTPLKVTIFYESLCPDCQTFFPLELLEAYTDTNYNYPSLISELELVPYGWVTVMNSTEHKYQCQHGPSECDGNRLQGCAIKYINNDLTSIKYIACLDQQRSNDIKSQSLKYPIDKCQDKLPEGLYQKIISCYNSNESWEIFEKNGQKTNSFFPPLEGFVPYVSFNNKRDDYLADAAANNFRATLCKVAGVHDKACSP